MLAHETNTSISLKALQAYAESLTDESVEIRRIIRDPYMPYSYGALNLISSSSELEKHFNLFHRKIYNSLLELNISKLEGITVEVINSDEEIDSDIIEKSSAIFNHQLFWDNLSPFSGEMSKDLELAFITNFISIDKLKKSVIDKGVQLEGNGWIWVVKMLDGTIEIMTTKDNENPFCCDERVKGIPLLVFDLWDHSMAGKFENNRKKYLENLWHLVNWSEVSRRFEVI